jgi:hypothetical protein
MRSVENAENFPCGHELPPLLVCPGHVTAQRAFPIRVLVQKDRQMTRQQGAALLRDDGREPVRMNKVIYFFPVGDAIKDGNVHGIKN